MTGLLVVIMGGAPGADVSRGVAKPYVARQRNQSDPVPEFRLQAVRIENFGSRSPLAQTSSRTSRSVAGREVKLALRVPAYNRLSSEDA
jgi:hypothetical protein